MPPKNGIEPEALLSESPLVVIAEVVATEIVDRPVQISPADIPWPTGGPGTPGPGDDPKSGLPTGPITWGYYSTRYTLNVQEVIKASSRADTAAIHILAGGATIDGQEIGYEGVPIFRVSERYLLFLKPNPARRPEGDFSAHGGYGAFLLKAGVAYRPLGSGGSWIPYQKDGAPVSEDALLASLSAAVDALATQ
jgi:hypothetical protein